MKYQSLKMSKSLLLLAMPAVLSLTACTKKRDASFSEDEAEAIFAISDFGNLESDKSEFSIETSKETLPREANEKLKAASENDVVLVEDANVPKRLRFMFEELEVSAKPNSKVDIVFSLDRSHLTAWKEVADLNSLSALEKQYAKAKAEVVLAAKIQKANTAAQREKLALEIKKISLKSGHNTTAKYLVPLFKYQIMGKGVVTRIKNDLKEETSNLRLKDTDWAQATHVRLNPRKDALNPVGLDATDKEQLDRTFSAKNIHQKHMTAQDLRENFKVSTSLNDNAQIFTTVDDRGLNIFEITDITSLTESELKSLKAGAAKGEIEYCSAEQLKAIGKTDASSCVSVHRFVVPVSFVKVKLPPADRFGSEGATARLETVPYSENAGLVHIPEMAEPRQVSKEQVYDSSGTIRVADIKGHEFFFRRTLVDAPVSTSFMPGDASDLITVKFELEDAKLIVRRADKVIEHKTGSNDTDFEDVMSIPVKYLRLQTVDARGNKLSTARWIETNKDAAEVIQLNWANNTLPSVYSPLSYLAGGQCIAGLSDLVVSKVDRRLDQGTLNFSYSYKAALQPNEACVGIYKGGNSYDHMNLGAQLNARLEERVSFLRKDVKKHQNHQDESYVNSLSFADQNRMGFGVWTLGRLNPSKEGGSFSRNGEVSHAPAVHDFRNGRKLVYTVTNLPKDNPERAQTIKETVIEVVQAWNVAYQKAFKGFPGFERNGNYVEVVFAGENGVAAELGDLDKNIIHIENKINDNHGVLGVSQIGLNTKSGIVIADSLIIYAGNLANFVEGTRRSMKNLEKYETQGAIKTQIIKKKQAALAKNSEPATEESSKKQVAANTAPKAAAQLGTLKSFKTSTLSDQQLRAKIAQLIDKNKLNSQSLTKSINTSGNDSLWLVEVMNKISKAGKVDDLTIETILAEEMVTAFQKKAPASEIQTLKAIVSKNKIKAQMQAKFAAKNGCALHLSSDESALGRAYANDTFEQAFKRALYFDLAHEMGHSQGLTHNFIASFDKANWARDAKGNTISNYSSVMDYMDPAFFQWKGIGAYDIHAIRAVHTGYIELNETAKNDQTFLEKAKANISADVFLNNQFLNIGAVKGFATKNNINVADIKMEKFIKAYKYCSDMEVGYEITCERFDLGGTYTDIIKNQINRYKSHIINNYAAWDRLEFGYAAMSRAYSNTFHQLFSIRRFMDEYVYQKSIRRLSQEEDKDLREAADLSMSMLLGVAQAPVFSSEVANEDLADASKGEKLSLEFPIQVDTAFIKNQNGDVEFFNFPRLPMTEQMISQSQFRTLGQETNKLMALQILTLKDFPHYKYSSINLSVSFAEYEAFVHEVPVESSLVLNLLSSALTWKQTGAVVLDDGGLVFVGSNPVSSSMVYYSAISSVLGLNSHSLDDEFDFSNLFKIGMSVGTKPQDRVSVSSLQSNAKSSYAVSYWAVDGGKTANYLITKAHELRKAIDTGVELRPTTEALTIALIKKNVIKGLKERKNWTADEVVEVQESTKAIAEAKQAIINSFKNANLVSEQQVAKYPDLAIEKQVEMAVAMMEGSIQYALASAVKPEMATAQGPATAIAIQEILDGNPLANLVIAPLKVIAANYSNSKEGNDPLATVASHISNVLPDSKFEAEFQRTFSIISLLGKMTSFTNPELSK